MALSTCFPSSDRVSHCRALIDLPNRKETRHKERRDETQRRILLEGVYGLQNLKAGVSEVEVIQGISEQCETI